jgi:hypothetical protein
MAGHDGTHELGDEYQLVELATLDGYFFIAEI